MRPDEEMAKFGRKLVASGLTYAHFGNISILSDGKILITATGSMLDEIEEEDVIEVDLRGPCSADALASCETPVHRAIYERTQARALIHTHSPYAVATSILEVGPFEPMDGEGVRFLGTVPIIDGEMGSHDLANKASFALRFSRAAIVRGHGVFAIGATLEEAYIVASMVEHSATIRRLVSTG
ncbi:aldolase [Methanotrichaceae archaeon M04Ac]|uniref:Aldolase n=1 Tax=Candidatus Methanocrinis alkalitolerans TaxID=3033395 RepID=A0ABT5XC08_9EURY|nr:aldolase [Candidatus Methanocrinis alkalitolerans]MCR3883062.1 aldolase [Methanothrix sp.]MDF0592226.1 aldolase [Candidatus Methanocrinis alkalitolerans]